MQTNRGIGVFAAVVIIAVIAIGGIAAVQVAKRAETGITVDEQAAVTATEAEVQEAKEEARSALVDLRSQLDISGNIDATLAAIADVRADLVDVYANAQAETKAEMEVIIDKLDTLELEVRNRSEEAVDSFAEVIASIDASLGMDTSSETEVDATATTTEDGMSGEADATMDADMSADDTGASVESETTVDVELR